MIGAATAARPRPRPATTWITYAADVAAWPRRLDLRNAIHIGHSTGGGEVARYVARHGKPRPCRQGGADQRGAANDAQVGRQSRRPAVEVFDGFRAALAANRAQFYLDVADRPVLRLQPAGATVSQGLIETGGARA